MLRHRARWRRRRAAVPRPKPRKPRAPAPPPWLRRRRPRPWPRPRFVAAGSAASSTRPSAAATRRGRRAAAVSLWTRDLRATWPIARPCCSAVGRRAPPAAARGVAPVLPRCAKWWRGGVLGRAPAPRRQASSSAARRWTRPAVRRSRSPPKPRRASCAAPRTTSWPTRGGPPTASIARYLAVRDGRYRAGLPTGALPFTWTRPPLVRRQLAPRPRLPTPRPW